MNRSEELERWVRSVFASTDPEAVGSATADGPEVISIGTDAGEWTEGGEEVRRAFAGQVGGGVTIEQHDLQAFEEGTVGWGAGNVTFVLSTGERLDARVTFVAHREGTEWRLVQSHASVAQR